MQADRAGTPSYSIADLLDTKSDLIIERYERDLRAMRSRLLQDPTTANECFAQARAIIADIARSLRGETTSQTSLGLAKEIGVSRAAQSIHPSESLRAAIALFEAITITCGELASPDEVPSGDLLALTLATNKLVSQRIRMAASAYMGFLLQSIEEVHLAERKRISRELHDRIGGNVAAAHRQIELFKARESVGAAAAAMECIDKVEDGLRLALDDLRRLISDLRMWEPEGSLETSLVAYIERSRPLQLEYSLSVNGDEFNLSPEIRGEVFLIIREAVRNAITHAHAGKLLAQVNITPNELFACIEDDGIGVDLSNGNSPASSKAGLASMRERAALLEGEVMIMSQPGRGTRVELLVPLVPAAEALDA